MACRSARAGGKGLLSPGGRGARRRSFRRVAGEGRSVDGCGMGDAGCQAASRRQWITCSACASLVYEAEGKVEAACTSMRSHFSHPIACDTNARILSCCIRVALAGC